MRFRAWINHRFHVIEGPSIDCWLFSPVHLQEQSDGFFEDSFNKYLSNDKASNNMPHEGMTRHARMKRRRQSRCPVGDTDDYSDMGYRVCRR